MKVYQRMKHVRIAAVVLAVCLPVACQFVAIAQNLGAAPQTEAAVQGQNGTQPEGTVLNCCLRFFLRHADFTTPTGAGGTAYLRIGLDGSGSVPESPGVVVYGSSYASLLAGEVGTGLAFSRVTDVTNTSASDIIESDPIPFQSGVPVNIEVALSSNPGLRCNATTAVPAACSQWAGMGMTDFSHTAILTGIELVDTSGTFISGFSVSSTSGTAYGPNGVVASPEPDSLVLSVDAFVILGVIQYRRSLR